MGCRCNERREAIKTAVQSKSIKQAANAAKFVLATMADDAGRAIAGSRRRPK